MVFCESGLLIFDRYETSSDDDDDDDERLTFGDVFFLFFGLVWFGGSLCSQSMDLRCPGN
jgi:hypothetical protein